MKTKEHSDEAEAQQMHE